MGIRIGNKIIDKNKPCFIIAEAGVNHKLESYDMKRIGADSSLEVAFRMVDEAKKANVDGIKFQSFTNANLQYQGTKNPKYQVRYVGTDEDVSYYEMLKKLETSKEHQKKIADYCREKGIMFLSTPYGIEDADFLDEVINVPIFKLASIELNNHLLIRHISKKEKPFILSTGLSDITDVRKVINIAKNEGFSKRIVILQCTSSYPTKPEEINLNVLKTYMSEFPDILFGFSDHSPTDRASIGAVAIGAVLLEKHFTLDKSFKGPDHSSSLNLTELTEWVAHVREIETSMGSYIKKVTRTEKENETMRKYLVITPQKKGAIVQENMLRAMRTGKGILPVDKNIKDILGKRLKKEVKKLSPLKWNMIEPDSR